jgi:HAD superfamily hydrolase (TIGR01490 family)
VTFSCPSIIRQTRTVHLRCGDRGWYPATMNRVEAAFFDLDKTVVSKSSSLALTRPMYRAGLVSRSALVRGAYAQLVYLLVGADERKMEKAKEAMLALSRGWDREQVQGIVREALETLIDPYIYLEAVDLMELHRARGRKVFIVSSSPEDVVRPLAERLGDVDVIATRAEIEGGRYTGNLEFYNAGENKAVAIREVASREGIDLSGSFAYSDSISDLPMLESVGNPVAVNPDRELRRMATERGWQVRDFRRPVRLRERFVVRQPSPRATRIALGALVVGVVGWLALRYRVARLGRSAERDVQGRGWVRDRLPTTG